MVKQHNPAPEQITEKSSLKERHVLQCQLPRSSPRLFSATPWSRRSQEKSTGVEGFPYDSKKQRECTLSMMANISNPSTQETEKRADFNLSTQETLSKKNKEQIIKKERSVFT